MHAFQALQTHACTGVSSPSIRPFPFFIKAGAYDPWAADAITQVPDTQSWQAHRGAGFHTKRLAVQLGGMHHWDPYIFDWRHEQPAVACPASDNSSDGLPFDLQL